MKFELNTDIEEELSYLINPDDFVKEMLALGEIETLSNVYGDNVYSLCRNSVAWILNKLIGTAYIYDIEIIEGTFKNKDHAWIKIGNYYVDLTLAQFIDAPKFAVTLIKDSEKIGYKSYETFNPVDWINQVEIDNIDKINNEIEKRILNDFD